MSNKSLFLICAGAMLMFWVIALNIEQPRYYVHKVEANELQARIDELLAGTEMRVSHDFGELEWGYPHISLTGDKAEVKIGIAGKTAGVLSVPFSGIVTFATKIRYTGETVYLEKPELKDVRINGYPTSILGSTLQEYIGNVFYGVLDGMPIYTLDEKVKAKLPPFVSVQGIELKEGKLAVTLKLG